MKLFVGYSKAPEQPQNRARPMCQSHTMTSMGANQRPYALLPIWTCQLWFQLLELHFCPKVLVLGAFVLKHYNVISIEAANVVRCIALQGIVETTTLMDNIIEEMQFRCFLVSALHSQASNTYILTLKLSFFVT